LNWNQQFYTTKHLINKFFFDPNNKTVNMSVEDRTDFSPIQSEVEDISDSNSNHADLVSAMPG